ncbi:ABC transporter permease [Treponema primitia]|uniref:ABC transporter permease n=1 Tax=Treponema primitia TaxID=88058 RepID=UPI000255571E|nr:ABC transporter permease [Treponema primitia]
MADIAQTKQTKRNSRRSAFLVVSKFGTIIGMVIMFLAFSIAVPRIFPTPLNMVNIVNQASLSAIIAGGLTMALIVGEMDLSIANLASFAGVLVTGLMVNYHLPMPLAIVVVLVVCILLGILNGIIITKLRVNAVVATLGTGSIIVGLNFAYARGVPIASGLPEAFQNLSIGKTLGIPNNILIMVAVLFLLWVFLNYTEWGVQLRATGGNSSAARLSGIRVDRVKMLGLSIGSFCAGITGILLASLIGSGTSAAADGYLMPAFAAVFLGSATLKDGDFHIVGTLIGVFFIAIGFNGLAIFGAPTYVQYFFRGGILIIAVGLSSIARIIATK